MWIHWYCNVRVVSNASAPAPKRSNKCQWRRRRQQHTTLTPHNPTSYKHLIVCDVFTFLCKFTHRAQLTVWTIKAQWLRFWCAMISMKEKSAAVNGIQTLDWIMFSKRCHLFRDFELIYATKISLKMMWFVFNWMKRCIHVYCWLRIPL